MELFWKATACIMIGAVLCLTLTKRDKDIAAVLSITVCCMVIGIAIYPLQNIVAFIYQLQSSADLDMDLLKILLKSVAIGITAQIAELVCMDSGNAAMGKTLQFLASIMIVVMALPLMEGLLEMIGKVLGGR